MTALAHGLPVVAYEPVRGNFEGYNIPYGVLVPREDEECFIQTAVKFMKDISSDPSGKNANIKYFKDHFSWPRIRDQYVEALIPR